MRPWSLGDLNSLPSECKSDALPGELRPRQRCLSNTLWTRLFPMCRDIPRTTAPPRRRAKLGHGHCSCSAVTNVGTRPYSVALAWKESNLQPRD